MLQSLRIEEYVAAPSQQMVFGRARVFKLRLQFFPEHLYPKEAGITFADVAKVFQTVFMLKLQVRTCCLLRKGKERKGKERKGKERKGKERKRKEKKSLDYAFWRQFNEKPSIIPGCPGAVSSTVATLCPLWSRLSSVCV